MKYKVGDKCKVLKNVCGEYNSKEGADHIKITGIRERSNDYCYDILDKDGNELGKCWGCLKDQHIELIETKPVPPFYVDCPTQEIWDKVEKKMFDMGYKWYMGERLNPLSYKFMCIDEYGRIFGAEVEFATEGGKHIPYQQFLGEEVKREFKVGDKVRILAHNTYDFSGSHGNATGRTGYIEDEENSVWSQPGGKGNYLGIFDTTELELITPVEEKEEKPKMRGYAFTNVIWDEFATYSSPKKGNPFYKFSKSIMDTLRTIPARIKKLLSNELQKMYQLNWIDSELRPTEKGVQALNEFLFDKYEKELGAIASEKVEEAEKAMKEREEDEDAD